MFFPLTRPYLAYIVLMFPHGVPWFCTFVVYIMLYHDLQRSGSLLAQSWEAFTDITPQPGPVAGLHVLTLELHNAKLMNKAVTVPITMVGRLGRETLATSPDPVFWISQLLSEQWAIDLLQLKIEKATNSTLWQQIKRSPMFCSDEGPYSASIANKHLKIVLTFLGFEPRIVGSCACHSSLRSGGSNDSQENVQNGRFGQSALSVDPFVLCVHTANKDNPFAFVLSLCSTIPKKPRSTAVNRGFPRFPPLQAVPLRLRWRTPGGGEGGRERLRPGTTRAIFRSASLS